MPNFLKNIITIAAHIIWPQFCPVCGRVGASFCEECLEGTLSRLPPFCMECGGRFGVPCCEAPVPCYAASAHEGLSRRFLINFKYHNARSIGEHMGRLMARVSAAGCGADLAVPVPLRRFGKREFNQSLVLAGGFSQETGIACDGEVLRWSLGTTRQMGKGRDERRSIPPGAVKSIADLSGKSIILIDDVYTTGATLRAARTAVEEAGGVVRGAFVWSRRLK